MSSPNSVQPNSSNVTNITQDGSDTTRLNTISASKSTTSSAQDAVDKEKAEKYMLAAVDETVGGQEVKSSGFLGSQNNSSDISKATEAAKAQAQDLIEGFERDGVSGKEALAIAEKFIENLEGANGYELSNSQMLKLEIEVSNAVSNDDSVEAKKTADKSTNVKNASNTAAASTDDAADNNLTVNIDPDSMKYGLVLNIGTTKNTDSKAAVA
jgi:hypothetical protein